jgi:tetratricopeptide (TPR) repeat protein
LKIKPNDVYCLDQLSEIDSKRKIFSKQKVDFDKAIDAANKSFDSSDWVDAKLYYEAALKIFPNDKTATDKISDIGFKRIEEQKKFNALLKYANQDFENKLWKLAKEKYEYLQKTKPDDKIIKDKLNTIKLKLSFNEQSEPTTTMEKPKQMGSEWEFGSKKKSTPKIGSTESDQNWDFAKKSDGHKDNNIKSTDKNNSTNQSEDQNENKKLNKKFDF